MCSHVFPCVPIKALSVVLRCMVLHFRIECPQMLSDYVHMEKFCKMRSKLHRIVAIFSCFVPYLIGALGTPCRCFVGALSAPCVLFLCVYLLSESVGLTRKLAPLINIHLHTLSFQCNFSFRWFSAWQFSIRLFFAIPKPTKKKNGTLKGLVCGWLPTK